MSSLSRTDIPVCTGPLKPTQQRTISQLKEEKRHHYIIKPACCSWQHVLCILIKSPHTKMGEIFCTGMRLQVKLIMLISSYTQLCVYTDTLSLGWYTCSTGKLLSTCISYVP